MGRPDLGTPSSEKKLKQARLPFAPVNKQAVSSDEVSKKRKLSGAVEEPSKNPRTEEPAHTNSANPEPENRVPLLDQKSEAQVGKKQKERKEVKAKKKEGKQEDGSEVGILNEDSIHGRPDRMAGRVKMLFKKNKSKKKKEGGKEKSDSEDIEFDCETPEETSMTDDWAQFHQQEMEKHQEEDPGAKSMESLLNDSSSLIDVDAKANHDSESFGRERHQSKPKSESSGGRERHQSEPKSESSVSDDVKVNKVAPNVPQSPAAVNLAETSPAAEASSAKRRKQSSEDKKSPVVTPKSVKTNPLAKFLVKMLPGQVQAKKTPPSGGKAKQMQEEEEEDEIQIIENECTLSKEKKTEGEQDTRLDPKESEDSTALLSTSQPAAGDKVIASTEAVNSSLKSTAAISSSSRLFSVGVACSSPGAGAATTPAPPQTFSKPETPASIRAKQVAVARLKVKIHELTDIMEAAVKAEEFLKAHEIKLQIQTFETELAAISSQDSFVGYSPVVNTALTTSSKEEESAGTLRAQPGKPDEGTPVSSKPQKTPDSSARKRKHKSPALGGLTPSQPGSDEKPAGTPASGKKMTPKQLALSEERRKKTESLTKEKEEKERKRLEAKVKKEREKEEKERHKEVERRVKEQERLEKERLKKEKEAEKELERQRKKTEKEAEARKKEEEKLKAEEAEAEKKKRTAQAFKQFFVKRPADGSETERGVVGTHDELKSDEGADNGGGLTTAGGNFTPFQVKKNMRLAPLLRNDPAAAKSRIDTLESPAGPSYLYLEILKRGEHRPGRQGKTWPFEKSQHGSADSDVEIVEEESDDDEDTSIEENVIIQHKTGPIPRAKLLQFHENQRPAYWGTWTKKTNFISGRKPFGQDKELFEYDYDSDDDWEEEEQGESLSDAEDEKEEEDDYEVDNEFFVPHGYLSDEEAGEDEQDEAFNPETAKEKLRLKEKEFQAECKKTTHQLKPRLWGCYWENVELDTGAAATQLVKILGNYSAILCCNNNLPIPTALSAPAASPSNCLGDDIGDSAKARSAKGPKMAKTFPEEAMLDLIRLVHANSNNKAFLAKEFVEFWRRKTGGSPEEVEGTGGGQDTPSRGSGQQIAKRKIVEKIQEIAEYKKLDGANSSNGRFWVVKSEVLEKHGGSNKPSTQNSWSYVLEQPSRNGAVVQEEGAAVSANSSRPSSPVGTGGSGKQNPASLITKFTKVLSQEERAMNLAKLATSPTPVITSKAAADTRPSPSGIKKFAVQLSSPSAVSTQSPGALANGKRKPAVKTAQPIAIRKRPGKAAPAATTQPCAMPSPLKVLAAAGLTVTRAAMEDNAMDVSCITIE